MVLRQFQHNKNRKMFENNTKLGYIFGLEMTVGIDSADQTI